MIFTYAKKWDIQAFITMHSEDLVRTFYNIGSQEGNLDEAAFIRLQENRQGELEAITYDMARMESALELDLEIR